MEKISQLMDGELGRRESQDNDRARWSPTRRSRSSWETYHLIGDCVAPRDGAAPWISPAGCTQRLGQEPTVIAPHMRLSHRVVRYTLPMAASVAGVTLVVWLALPPAARASPTVARQLSRVRAPAPVARPPTAAP